MCIFGLLSKRAVGNVMAFKGTNASVTAKERESPAERFPHRPALEPTPSPAATSRGVPRVKGFKRRGSAIWVVPRISPSHCGR